LLGAADGPHRVEEGTVKIDDPDSPLTRSFGGKSFTRVDEFYHFLPTGPYSREKLRVLLAVDTERSETSNEGIRPDRDYGLSWIKRVGKGRVFYTALGHTPTLFATPALAEHVLAGIQFALGDLEADTTPSAKRRH
jgi:type 1 glutamine amidotransferase